MGLRDIEPSDIIKIVEESKASEREKKDLLEYINRTLIRSESSYRSKYLDSSKEVSITRLICEREKEKFQVS